MKNSVFILLFFFSQILAAQDTVKLFLGDKEMIIITKRKHIENTIDSLKQGQIYFNKKIEEQQIIIKNLLDSLSRLTAQSSVDTIAIADIKKQLQIRRQMIEALQEGIKDIQSGIDEMEQQLQQLDTADLYATKPYLDTTENFYAETKKQFNSHNTFLFLGLTTLTPDFSTPSPETFLKQNFEKSVSIGFVLPLTDIKFWSSGGMAIGLGLQWRNIGLKNSYFFFDDNNKFSITSIDSNIYVVKSKIKTTSLILPVLFEIQMNRHKRYPFLQLGIIGEYAFYRIHKIKFYQNGQDVKLKEPLYDLINPFLAQATFRLGFKGFSVYANYTFLPFFNKTSYIVHTDYFPMTVGISF